MGPQKSKQTPKSQTAPTFLLCMASPPFRISPRKLVGRRVWPLSDLMCGVRRIQTCLSAWGCSTSSQVPPPTATTLTFSLSSLTSRYIVPLSSRAVLPPPIRATSTLCCLLRCARLVPCLRSHCAQESCSRFMLIPGGRGLHIAIEDIRSEMYLLQLDPRLWWHWEQLTFRSGGSIRHSDGRT